MSADDLDNLDAINDTEAYDRLMSDDELEAILDEFDTMLHRFAMLDEEEAMEDEELKDEDAVEEDDLLTDPYLQELEKLLDDDRHKPYELGALE